MRVRPTMRCLALLVAAVALAVLAYGSRQAVLLVPVGLAVGAVVAGVVLAIAQRPSRAVRWHDEEVGTEGEPMHAGFSIDPAFAEGSWRAATSLQRGSPGWWPFSGTPEGEVALHDPPRGVHDVGPVRARRRDALGILVVSQLLGDRHEVLVGPRITPLDAQSVLGPGLEAAATRSGAGDVPDQLVRDYRPGDPIRRIHWRQSAHHDRLMVRQDVPPATPQATVVLDTLAEGYDSLDEFDDAVRAFASLCVAMAAQGLEVRAIETGTPQLHGVTLHRQEALRAGCARLEPVATASEATPTGPAVVVAARGSAAALEIIDRLSLGSAVWSVGDAAPTVSRGVRLVRWHAAHPIEDRLAA